MRVFPYNTVGKILIQLKTEGVPVTRATFYRLEERLKLPVGTRTSGKIQWRVYSNREVGMIKNRIKKEYNKKIKMLDLIRFA